MSRQQITTVLDSMRNLGDRTDDILGLVTAQKNANQEAIRQMNVAAELIGRLMGGRQDLQAILETSTRTKEDQVEQVRRITDALNSQPSLNEMQTAITQLQTAISTAEQSGGPGASRGPGGQIPQLTVRPEFRGVQPVNNITDRGGPSPGNVLRRGGMRGGYYYSGSPIKTQKKSKSSSLTPKSRRKKSGRRK